MELFENLGVTSQIKGWFICWKKIWKIFIKVKVHRIQKIPTFFLKKGICFSCIRKSDKITPIYSWNSTVNNGVF